jgi:DNA adenine methylase
MTSYHGGKQRIGKRIANVIYDEFLDIENEYDFTIKGYCEPFCGMLGVYQHIPELFKGHNPKLQYIAGDTNKSVILMWKKAQKGWKPPTKISERKYNTLKYDKPSSLKGYVGHQYSFGGQFFKGYAPKYGKTLDSSKASLRIVDIAKKIKNISIQHDSYKQFSKLKNYIIYCDPPYEGTETRYYNKDGSSIKNTFNSNMFWDWSRKMSKHNIVFISEYNAPKDFESIFSSSHKLTGISPGKKNKKRTENLFIIY